MSAVYDRCSVMLLWLLNCERLATPDRIVEVHNGIR